MIGKLYKVFREKPSRFAAFGSSAPIILLRLSLPRRPVRLSYTPQIVHADNIEHSIRIFPKGMLHMSPVRRDPLRGVEVIKLWLDDQ